MPKISVLMPIYNTNPEHLRSAIDSILGQTFTDFEFLILNDSPQNKEIESIVKSYTDTRIKYMKNAVNIGISASRNKLLHAARGEYIAIFDHDDISVPERLQLSVDFLDRNPHVGVVSGWLKFFGNKDMILKNPEFDTDIKIYTTVNCYIAHTAAMIRKSVLTDNNIKYEEFYTPAEDYRLWARLMDVTMFHNLQTVLVNYRWFGNNTSSVQSDKIERARRSISLQLQNKYPAYYHEYCKHFRPKTKIKVRLFGFIPLFKIKHNWLYLFECVPLFKIFWK